MTKINKNILLSWLNSAPLEIDIEELGKWLETRSQGNYEFTRKIEGDK